MRRTALAFATIVLAAAAPEVQQAWVRASLPHQNGTAAYFTITSPQNDTLLSISTPAAGMAMLHATTIQGGMSGMTDLENLPLPAGRPVSLAPRGTHIMLMNVKRPLKPGDTVKLTLHFANAADLTIAAPVRSTPP